MNLLAALGLSALTVAAAAPSSPPPPAYATGFAPADRYFGRMKLSYLGINNTFHDAAILAGAHTTDPQIVNKVAFADEALSDWARRFPHDRQLPRSYFLAIRAEQKIWLKEYQEKAWIYMNRIVTLYPDTYFAKVIRRDLALGFTEHYYAAPAACVTPLPPTPAPEPSGKGLKVQVETPPCIPPESPSPEPSATSPAPQET